MVQRSTDLEGSVMADFTPTFKYFPTFIGMDEIEVTGQVLYEAFLISGNGKSASQFGIVSGCDAASMIGRSDQPSRLAFRQLCTHDDVRQISEHSVECVDCGVVSA